MPELLTMQGLANGHLDVKALGEAANGDENTIVTTRTGNTYPSAERAINIMFQNGGLPATPFATKALMTASSLANDKYAMVTDDTNNNNGLYRKTDNYFIKQSYNVASEAAKLVEVAQTRKNSNLVEFADKAGLIYIKVDKNGRLHVPDLPLDIQTHIFDIITNASNTEKTVLDIAGTTRTTGDNAYSMMLVDASDKLIFGIKKTGEIVSSEKRLINNTRPYYCRFDVNNAPYQAANQVNAPVPLGFAPSAFNVPDLINSLTVTQPINYTPIDTIYRNDDGVVHPCLLDFYSGFNGNQYWLGITPYFESNDKYENPFVFVSNDLKSFKPVNGIGAPLAERPYSIVGESAYNSDIFFTYDHHTGELIACWRLTYRGISESYNQIWGRRTRDGYNFSPKELIYQGLPNEAILSPSIVYDFDAKQYLLFCIDTNPTGGRGISRRTSTAIGAQWSNATFSAMGEIGPIEPWHLEVKYIGRQLCAVINDYDVTHNSYMAVSQDKGLSFTVGVGLISGTHDDPYKTTVIPVYKNNQMALQVMWTSTYTAADSSKQWKLYRNLTEFTDITGV